MPAEIHHIVPKMRVLQPGSLKKATAAIIIKKVSTSITEEGMLTQTAKS
jgi:hypothetical protein